MASQVFPVKLHLRRFSKNWPSSGDGGVTFTSRRNIMSNAKKTENTNVVSNETILKVTKEIAIKFIEVGKITPASFELSFSDIYATISKTVREK